MLTSAFAAFSEASGQLEASYRSLEQLLIAEVTRQRKLEELLARHRRLAAMGEMAAALAHQIRTPLAAGLLYASNAARRDLPPEQRESLLGKAIACLHDLEQLVSDMLQFARGASIAESDFSLAELFAGVENSLRPVVRPGQMLAVDRADPRIRLRGNREALAGALTNLATNSLQAAGPSARVEITARLSGLQVEILVSDNGPGVPAAIRPRIFDPFFTSRPDGTGLGLAVARSVARAHGGDVVLLEGEASGATFALRLPATGACTRQHERTAAA
jgi:two-component system sensor histidine kinase FlrB